MNVSMSPTRITIQRERIMRLEGATASDFPVGTVVPADREQGTPRLIVVSIDPDGTPVGELTRQRAAKSVGPTPAQIAESARLQADYDRWAADQRAHGGSVHMADVGDMGSLRDLDW